MAFCKGQPPTRIEPWTHGGVVLLVRCRTSASRRLETSRAPREGAQMEDSPHRTAEAANKMG